LGQDDVEAILQHARNSLDGGSRNNGSPDSEGYGSYQLSVISSRSKAERVGKQEAKRLQFPGPPARTGPTGTSNNEAEYRSLIAALEDLISRIHHANRPVGEFTLEIRGDSVLVLNQVQGTWQTKKEHLRPLRNRAQAIIALFKEVEFVWQPREESVDVLGY